MTTHGMTLKATRSKASTLTRPRAGESQRVPGPMRRRRTYINWISIQATTTANTMPRPIATRLMVRVKAGATLTPVAQLLHPPQAGLEFDDRLTHNDQLRTTRHAFP